MAQVLKDIKVVEHGTFITGPFAGMMLADLGADVVKVELPGTGDPFRAYRGELYSPHFQSCNRNKRSITLNTKDAAELARFDEMIAQADVYIQNFRPGVAEKLGAGVERLQKINPRLIYCAISGFGRDGPYSDRPSYDSVAQAYSGFMGLLVNPNDPRVVGPALADAMTGFYSAYGILGALHERSLTGKGRLVEVSMIEAMTHFNLDAFTHLFTIGQVVDPFSRARLSQSYVLECSDGKWVALHMSSPPKFWEGLAKAMERSDIFDDPRFSTREGRAENQEALIGVLQSVFKHRSRTEWCNRLLAEDVPHAPMYDSSEVPEDPQIKHLQMFVEAPSPVSGTFKTVRSPVSFDGERSLKVTAPPVLGQHNEQFKTGWPARSDE